MVWMLYGASGYTGKLVADLAEERGERPILAGRSTHKIATMATPLGLSHRTFDLSDPDVIAENLHDVDVVAHCAGPFSATSAPMVEACLRTGTHYLDITGEVDVFEAIFARHREAVDAGVVLLPGAGFDVVPTDCLASLVAASLPTATRLDLAFQAIGGLSAGTMKSAWEGIALGGRARVDGEIQHVPTRWRQREVPFPSAARTVTSLPWGDVSTAYRSTGIGNITTFTVLPVIDRLSQQASERGRKLLSHPVVQRLGSAAISLLVEGPRKPRRENSWTEVFAEARDDNGLTASAALIGPNPYDLTADAVLRAVHGLHSGHVTPGAHTPSTLFGHDFVRRLHGVNIIEPSHS